MKQFSKVNEILAVDSLESSDDGIFLTEDQLEAIETGLNAETVDPVEDLSETVNDLQSQLDTANQTITDLRAGPGSETAKVIVSKDTVVEKDADQNVSSSDKSFVENMEAVGEAYA